VPAYRKRRCVVTRSGADVEDTRRSNRKKVENVAVNLIK
jgi:hypothetical protein